MEAVLANRIPKATDFGYQNGGPFADNIVALTAAHGAGASDAALFLAFEYCRAPEGDPDQAFTWFVTASNQHNAQAIAAHRWLADFYMAQASDDQAMRKAYLHNEKFFSLYDKFWPSPNDERLHHDNPRIRAYVQVKHSLEPLMPRKEQTKLEQEAKAFCAAFPDAFPFEPVDIPDFLKTVTPKAPTNVWWNLRTLAAVVFGVPIFLAAFFSALFWLLPDPCKYFDSIELYGCVSEKDKAEALKLGDFDASGEMKLP